MKTYRQKQAKARAEAQEWQYNADSRNDSYFDLLQAQTRFQKLGKRYGLLKEFKENGII
jgi:hypothetical protein